MFKKFLCLLLLVILTSTVTLSALAAGCDNPQYNHGTLYAKFVSSNTSYTYVNTGRHHFTKTTYYTCELCDALGYGSFWTTTQEGDETHSLGRDEDGGHVHGTQTHRRNKYCSLCKKSFTTIYKCPGPPCPVYMGQSALETE